MPWVRPSSFTNATRTAWSIGSYFVFAENTLVEIFDHADAHRRSKSTKPLEPPEDPRDPWLAHYNHFRFQVENLDDYVRLLESRGVTLTGRKTGTDNSHERGSMIPTAT